MKTLLHLLDFPTVPPKSEKKPQRKCSVCFWSRLNNAHDRRLPWHEGALQTRAREPCSRRSALPLDPGVVLSAASSVL